MADGSSVVTVATVLEDCVAAAMHAGVSFNTLRQQVATTAKLHGIEVLGTDRVAMTIVVCYRGGTVVVPEPATYRQRVPLSTW